jgi:hypothetical protein
VARSIGVYEYLPEQERLVLRRLSIFVGGFRSLIANPS